MDHSVDRNALIVSLGCNENCNCSSNQADNCVGTFRRRDQRSKKTLRRRHNIFSSLFVLFLVFVELIDLLKDKMI